MTAIENAINSLVPSKYQGAAKAIYALVISILTVVALVAGAPTWVPIALLVLNAPLVYTASNKETVPAPEDEYVPEHASE